MTTIDNDKILTINYYDIIRIQPFTTYWWNLLCNLHLTNVTKDELCDHGLSFEQIKKYLSDIQNYLSSDDILNIRKAYFSLIHGKNRLINVDYYNENSDLDKIFSYDIFKIENEEKLFEIFGYAAIIYKLNTISEECLKVVKLVDIKNKKTLEELLKYEQKYYDLCKKYKIESNLGYSLTHKKLQDFSDYQERSQRRIILIQLIMMVSLFF